ncbi:MAG TPA: shikimate dehydrogenase [Planctomycetota bacterium]|nr:shikimate dehydrogenase [Planctomycetota bacterium]
MADICVASHHSSIAGLLADNEFAALANRAGFLVELRLDFYSDLSSEALDRALNRFSPSCVVTCRHPDEGGKNPALTNEQRLQFLQQAANRGVMYVDIEARTPRSNFDKKTSTLVVSAHDFTAAPENLLRSQPGKQVGKDDVEKIACMPVKPDDQLLLMRTLRERIGANWHGLLLGMGEAGLWTRILAPLFGAPFTFARGEGAPGTAPGQPTCRELDELYRVRQMRTGWPIYGVIGNPIGHSLSPLLHNTAFRELNMDGVYVPLKVEGDPVAFVKTFGDIGLRGVSITIPHKEANWSAIAEIDELARNIGAVNTLSFRDGRWHATNTDASGAVDSLEAVSGSLRGKRVAILGAGGAARAVAYGIRERGGEILIANRTRERAEALAKAVAAGVITPDALTSSRIDVVVNTTSVGMHPKVGESPLEKEQIPQGSIVFDTVYNPLRTKLLTLAEERGCRTLGGAEMFIGQGVRQFELWTGRKAPRAAVSAAILAALSARQARQ